MATRRQVQKRWDEERDMSDAPVWFSAEEASAWACGWDAAVRACVEAQNAALERETS